jgi:hypothetical protein
MSPDSSIVANKLIDWPLNLKTCYSRWPLRTHIISHTAPPSLNLFIYSPTSLWLVHLSLYWTIILPWTLLVFKPPDNTNLIAGRAIFGSFSVWNNQCYRSHKTWKQPTGCEWWEVVFAYIRYILEWWSALSKLNSKSEFICNSFIKTKTICFTQYLLVTYLHTDISLLIFIFFKENVSHKFFVKIPVSLSIFVLITVTYRSYLLLSFVCTYVPYACRIAHIKRPLFI